MPEHKDSFFFQYGKYISVQHGKKNITLPFKDHVQFPTIVDILSRKNNHHIILNSDFSPNFHLYFIEALVQYLTNENIPDSIRNVDIIYLDLTNIECIKNKLKNIEKDFLNLIETLDTADKFLLFVLPDTTLLSQDSVQNDSYRFLQQQFNILFTHSKCRFMAFSNHPKEKKPLNPQFYSLTISGLNEVDVITILKLQCIELENFHHVLIPEELLRYAYSLAERYLCTTNPLEKALLLLDSSAGRIAETKRLDNDRLKPALSTSALTTVLSGWTQIPAANLQLHKFKYHEFIQHMQQKIFGQDYAISLLGSELQKSLYSLQKSDGPLCSFLFAGSEHSGKNSTAIALAEQLFSQLNVLYYVQPTYLSSNSFNGLKLQRYSDKHCIPLKNLIQQMPYAIIIFENIDKASPAVLNGLQEVLSTGYFHDLDGKQYNFRQSIFILTTTIGSNRLVEIAKSFMTKDIAQGLDLMQLIMNEKKYAFSNPHYSAQEIADEITTDLINYLPLCEFLHIVPFLPLNLSAVEKVVQTKLKSLGRQLEASNGIEFSYAQEVIRYLANETIKKKEANNFISIDQNLKQLYFVVEQALFNQGDSKTRSNQLYLQLNETGQILRCEWLATSPIRYHHLDKATP